MLGTRGCRLGVIKPGLYTMQVRALMEAAVERKQAGGDPRVEIMIPLVVSGPELELLTKWTREAAQAVIDESGVDVDYLVGTMIETPRAAIDAAAIGRGGRVLLLRHQRPDPDDVRVLPRRRRGPDHDALPGEEAHPGQPVRDPRPGRRRRARPLGRARRAAAPGRTSSSASAASTAATRPRSTSATRWASTTCPARRSGCPWPGSPPPTPPSGPAVPAAPPERAGLFPEQND